MADNSKELNEQIKELLELTRLQKGIQNESAASVKKILSDMKETTKELEKQKELLKKQNDIKQKIRRQEIQLRIRKNKLEDLENQKKNSTLSLMQQQFSVTQEEERLKKSISNYEENILKNLSNVADLEEKINKKLIEKVGLYKEEAEIQDDIIEQTKTKVQSFLQIKTTSGKLMENIINMNELSGGWAKSIAGVRDGFIEALNPTMLMLTLVDKMKEIFLDINKINSEFAGKAGQLMPLTNVNMSNDLTRFGISARDVQKSFQDMMLTQTSFYSLNQSQQTELAKAATTMDRFGISIESSAKLFDDLNKSLGVGLEQVSSVEKELVKMAIGSGIAPSRMISNYSSALPKLAAYGKESILIFENIAKSAKSLNIEESKLLDLMGQFDTFEDAAKNVGKFNAVLGGDYLNAIEMLNQSEDERLISIKKSMDLSGVQFQNLDKYTKKAIAASIGISDINEANKLFGKSTQELQSDLSKQATTQEQLNKTLERTAMFQDKLNKIWDHLVVILNPIVEIVERLFGWLAKLSDFLGNAFIPTVAFAAVGIKLVFAVLNGSIATTIALVGTVLPWLTLLTGAFWLLHWAFNKKASPSTLESLVLMNDGVNNIGNSIDKNLNKVNSLSNAFSDVKLNINDNPIIKPQIASASGDVALGIQETSMKVTQRNISQMNLMIEQKDNSNKLNNTLTALNGKLDNLSKNNQFKIILDGKELKSFVHDSMDSKKIG